jgi:hypothetical protein
MSILDSIGRSIYQIGFQLTPIILVQGIARSFPGQMMPIIILTEGPNLLVSVLAGKSPFNPDKFFAHFSPVPGGKLANFVIGQYPFANQSVAANAIISEPLTISMRMSIPVNKSGGHTAKLATMVLLQSKLKDHANLGGTYIVATPAGFYTNCILTGLTDVSTGESPIPQNAWQWDFVQPLITLQEAEAAQNTFMSNTTNQLPSDGALSGNSGGVPSTNVPGSQGTNLPPGVQGPNQ